jgi:hypothetical protein
MTAAETKTGIGIDMAKWSLRMYRTARRRAQGKSKDTAGRHKKMTPGVRKAMGDIVAKVVYSNCASGPEWPKLGTGKKPWHSRGRRGCRSSTMAAGR